MQVTQMKEDISISYISALCAIGGIDYEIIRHDADSSDGLLKKIIRLDGGRRYSAELHIQLKCTSSKSQYTDYGSYLTYTLKVKNYNDLCMEGTAPRILGLLVLPENESDWAKWTAQELLLRGCMYWADFSGRPESNNANTINVRIEKANVINTDSLLEILKKIAKEEWP